MTQGKGPRPRHGARPQNPTSDNNDDNSAPRGREAHLEQGSRLYRNPTIGDPRHPAGWSRGAVIMVEDVLPREGEFDARTVLYQLAFLARPDLGLCRCSNPIITPAEPAQCRRCGGLHDPDSGERQR
jgi:hypothetical protein